MILNLSSTALFAAIIAATAISALLNPVNTPQLNTPQGNVVSVSSNVSVSPVRYTAYGNSYSVRSYQIGKGKDGNTIVTLFGNGYNVMSYQNGKIHVPVWCSFESGGSTYDSTGATESSDSIEFQFNTPSIPEKIMLTNQDTGKLIASFP